MIKVTATMTCSKTIESGFCPPRNHALTSLLRFFPFFGHFLLFPNLPHMFLFLFDTNKNTDT